ncbi:MAG TPA: hypothetical protein VLE97_11755 [Gaiellaceae bacterium]|nr:hypothetical protein [Gaiellaceae bacterium]
MARKKSPAQLDREIAVALKSTDLQKLVDKWKGDAAFAYGKAQQDPSDAEYRHGYAAAMEAAARDLSALIQKG